MGEALSAGAEYSETRLLASGPRTNPWMQEASDRVVEKGDLVALDTDLVGRDGYLTDYSRTYLCGDRAPTDEQRRLYSVAYEFVHSAIAEFVPEPRSASWGNGSRVACPMSSTSSAIPSSRTAPDWLTSGRRSSSTITMRVRSKPGCR
jgi:hypothetical protein